MLSIALKKLRCISLIFAGLQMMLSCRPTPTTSTPTMQPLCDTTTGACALPESNAHNAPHITVKTITIDYFTDPICSSCWGFEPQLRRLKMEYGAMIDFRYCMGGLLPDWSYNSGGISKPSDVYGHWREVALYYEMPIDGSVWLTDPLHSSYPPSIAFKAAQLQDKTKAMDLLRRLREMVFIENRNIAQWSVISEAAHAIGLDTTTLRHHYTNEAKAAFEADLQYTRQNGVRGFPTLILRFPDGQTETLYGSKPYAMIAQALQKGAPDLQPQTYPKHLSHLLTLYPTWTAKEVSVALEIPVAQAEQQLRAFAADGQLEETKIVNGSIWRKR